MIAAAAVRPAASNLTGKARRRRRLPPPRSLELDLVRLLREEDRLRDERRDDRLERLRLEPRLLRLDLLLDRELRLLDLLLSREIDLLRFLIAIAGGGAGIVESCEKSQSAPNLQDPFLAIH